MNRLLQPSFYLWQGLWLAAALLSGGLLHWLVPMAFEPRATSAPATLKLAGIGLIVLVVTPVAAVLGGISIVGLPASLIAFGVWLAALYLAGLFTAAWLGRLVLRRDLGGLRGLLLTLLAGQLILRFASQLPYLGGLTCFLSLLLGLGLLWAALRAVYLQLRTQ